MAATSVSGLIKWLSREPWREAFLDVLDEHFGEVLAAYDLEEFDELSSLIDVQWTMTLWGCAFEDFLTRDVPGVGNMAEDYLKRRGWNESATNRAYIAGLRNSVMSLYEASDIRPGESFMARDLLRGGEPVLISERTATKTLKPWERLAMRVVDQRGTNVIGGGLLPIDFDMGESLMEAIGETERFDPETFCQLTPIFTDAFLESTVEHALGEFIPEIVNNEGDAIEFIRVVFQHAKGATPAEIRKALDDSPALEATETNIWNCIEFEHSGKQPKETSGAGDLKWQTNSASGNVVLGQVELCRKTVEFQTNSEARAERGQTMLSDLLDGLVGFPLMERQTLESTLADFSGSSEQAHIPDLDAAEERQIVHDMMDRHYRKQLDEPIPALGDISPRKAVESGEGIQKVEAWLKRLENLNARTGEEAPMASYDTTWLWEELGILEHRK